MRRFAIALGLLVTLASAQQEKKAMETNPHDRRIDYVEFPATDVARTKEFYGRVFGWEFTDYGPDYTSFTDGRLAGGFSKELKPASGSGPLVVIYALDLAGTEKKVLQAGGKISKAIFEFPGGKRFHFIDPSGNELAVWSEK